MKEYEARCFVGSTRLAAGTAKRLSELRGIPRTQVCDAVRILETSGGRRLRRRPPNTSQRAYPFHVVA
ncbi:MAG: hypothetical protein R6U01_07845 [Halorubrum sp.]